MKVLSGAVLFFVLIGPNLQAFDRVAKDRTSKDRSSKDRTSKDQADKDQAGKEKAQPDNWSISGFRDVAGEREVEKKFMAVPDPALAEEHLRILTQAPHIAASP
jgi:hypothetical protein